MIVLILIGGKEKEIRKNEMVCEVVLILIILVLVYIL